MITQFIINLLADMIGVVLSVGPAMVLPGYLESYPVGDITCGSGSGDNLQCLMGLFGQQAALFDDWLPIDEALGLIPFLFEMTLALMTVKLGLRVYGMLRGGGGE